MHRAVWRRSARGAFECRSYGRRARTTCKSGAERLCVHWQAAHQWEEVRRDLRWGPSGYGEREGMPAVTLHAMPGCTSYMLKVLVCNLCGM